MTVVKSFLYFAEKSPGHPHSGREEKHGDAEHERSGQFDTDVATECPHPQHVQRGPGGRVHARG